MISEVLLDRVTVGEVKPSSQGRRNRAALLEANVTSFTCEILGNSPDSQATLVCMLFIAVLTC